MSDSISICVSLTEQLREFSSGDREMAEAVLREVLPKLHEIAVRQLKKERKVAPVTPTELINEVWIRNLHKGGWQISSREHFYRIAALAMRRVLVDLARNRLAQRRGSGQAPGAIEEQVEHQHSADPQQVLEIGLLMDRLEQIEPEIAEIVDMQYFAGFTLEEIAEIKGLTFRQVRHRWERGRDWLKDHLGP